MDDSAFARLLALKDTMTPWALRAVVTLGVPDLLADGEADVAELARRTGTVPEALHRALRLLAAHGVLAAPRPGVYGPTDLSRLLESGHPMSLRPWLDLDGAVARGDRACVHVLEALRTGRPVHERAYGRPVWDDLAADPGLAASFDAAMERRAAALAPTVVAAFDWSSVRHVLDVGGGTGAVLAAVLRARPALRGTLFDRAATVAAARAAWGATPEGRRCAFVGGSFFDALPRTADAALLVNVVHDWPDEHAEVVLRRCAEAVGAGGRVLVVEYARPDDSAASPSGPLELDLLLALVYGGRLRRPDELGALADRAGLESTDVSAVTDGLILMACSVKEPCSRAASR